MIRLVSDRRKTARDLGISFDSSFLYLLSHQQSLTSTMLSSTDAQTPGHNLPTEILIVRITP